MQLLGDTNISGLIISEIRDTLIRTYEDLFGISTPLDLRIKYLTLNQSSTLKTVKPRLKFVVVSLGKGCLGKASSKVINYLQEVNDVGLIVFNNCEEVREYEYNASTVMIMEIPRDFTSTLILLRCSR